VTKTKNPVFSLGAHGTISDALTFQRRSGVDFVRTKPIPQDRYSLPQAYHRWDYQDYAYLWHFQTPAEVAVWRASGARQGITAFNAFMRDRLNNLPDLAARWHLDEQTGATAFDTSPNTNNGTIFGASPIDGFISWARDFDGIDDRIQMPYNATLEPNNKTLEALILPQHTVGTHIIAGTFNYAGGLANKGYSLDFDGTTLRSYLATGTGAYLALNKAGVALGVPHHVALIHDFDNSHAYLLLDGEQVHDLAITGYTPNTDTFWIGRILGTWYFLGIIDEVKLYNVAQPQELMIRHAERRYPL